jgi:hypothetical protein
MKEIALRSSLSNGNEALAPSGIFGDAWSNEQERGKMVLQGYLVEWMSED